MMKKWFSSIIIILIFCFIQAGNLSGQSFSIEQYTDQAKYWEKDIQKLKYRDLTETDPDSAILFVGSSSIRLWSTIKEDMHPYPVIQRGYGGAKFSDVAWYAKDLIYPHQFRALVIFVANDITGAPDDKSPETIVKLFEYIVETVHQKFPEKPIFLIEITPTQSRWDVWPQIQAANRALQAFCESRPDLYFIETAETFLTEDGLPDSSCFVEDCLHLNQKGYQRWADLIKTSLKQNLLVLTKSNLNTISDQIIKKLRSNALWLHGSVGLTLIQYVEKDYASNGMHLETGINFRRKYMVFSVGLNANIIDELSTYTFYGTCGYSTHSSWMETTISGGLALTGLDNLYPGIIIRVHTMAHMPQFIGIGPSITLHANPEVLYLSFSLSLSLGAWNW